jgi:hypothetical protein
LELELVKIVDAADCQGRPGIWFSINSIPLGLDVPSTDLEKALEVLLNRASVVVWVVRYSKIRRVEAIFTISI